MTTLLAFLVTLALLIVVHELGHYAAARWAGVRVLKFSVGFGRPLFKRTDRHGTEWAVAAIPLGGFVKFLDEREDSVAPDQQAYTFNRQPLGKRAIIVAAGPIANFLLAIGLLWILNMHGIPALRPIVAEPPSGTAAALADLRSGDVIVTLNSLSIPDWQTLAEQLLLDNQTDARLEVEDAHGHLRQAVLPREALLTAAQEANPIHALGLYPGTPPMAAVVGAVIADDPAARAGLQVGDRILAVDETLTEDWQGLVQRIRQTHQGDLSIRLERAGQTLTLSVRPERVVDAGQTITRIGIAPRIDPALLAKMRVIHRYGPIDAATQAIQRTWDLSVFSLRMMGRMLIGEVSLQNISGPISIADYAGQSAQAGWVAFVGFLALISVSLGVLNLLPIPMLDGGHLLYYLIEWVTGRPVSDRLQEQAQRVGMALLLTLMTFAIYNDLTRLLNS